MGAALDLLRRESQARLFFLAHAQSSLGTGAGYIGLLILAYERFESPWAITMVLLADFLPAMFLGPVFGAAADRWSRRSCAVVADIARAIAFIGIGLVGGFELTVLFALLAGAGTGLFTPAVLAGLPSLVARERLPAATALYGAIADVGHTAGPGLAAAFLLITDPETLMIANGVTFAVSAAVMATLSFGARRRRDDAATGRMSLFREARDGLRLTAGMSGVRVVIVASSAALLFAGMINVAELLLATEDLDAGHSAFSVLVALFGFGIVVGSLIGSRGGSIHALKRRYLAGLVVFGLGLAGSGLAPVYEVALVTFMVAGIGNGLLLVHERLIFQNTVSDELMGRVFGVKDALMSWAFGIAFLSAGAIVSLVGARPLFVLAGCGTLAVWAASALALGRIWTEDRTGPPVTPVQGVRAES